MSHSRAGAALALGPTSQSAAERFLESLQRRVYASLGMSEHDCQHREWMGQQVVLPARLQQMSVSLAPQEFERYRAHLLEGLARDEQAHRPTAFERPHQYSILRELKTAVERAAARLRLPLPVEPVIGTLPTQLLEPLMLPVPGTSDIVMVVDGGLLTYANQLAKAVAQALPCSMRDDTAATVASADEWTAAIDAAGSGRTRFAELLMAALAGNPAGARSYLPRPDWEDAAVELCEAMELFIVAREYARLIEGDHLEARPERRSAHGQPFEALVWTGEQELKADWMGLALTMAAADEQGLSAAWAFWSVDVLLASFAIYDRAIWTLQMAETGVSTAPSVSVHDERRRLLRRLMSEWTDGHAVVEFADRLQPILDTLEAHLAGTLAMRQGIPETVH